VFYHLRNIAKLSSIVSRSELEIIIHAFISSRLDYCNSLFTCLSKTSMDRLQVVQNAAAKLLTKSSKRSHVSPLLISLHWLPIKFRIQFKILDIGFNFQSLHGQTPTYTVELLQPYTPGRSLSDHLTRVCWSFLIQDLKLKVTEPLRSRLRHFGTLSHQA
ncbi:hypothetical protein LDENG_00176370, partial [Lucifuga dentata]